MWWKYYSNIKLKALPRYSLFYLKPHARNKHYRKPKNAMAFQWFESPPVCHACFWTGLTQAFSWFWCCQCSIVVNFFWVLGMEPRASCMLGELSTPWAMSQPCSEFFAMDPSPIIIFSSPSFQAAAIPWIRAEQLPRSVCIHQNLSRKQKPLENWEQKGLHARSNYTG
jgi:hypothetical protein